MSLVDELTDMVTPILAPHQYRLWNLKVTKTGRRSIVSVVLDKDGGATLDGIADMSKEMAPLLDEHPSLGEYHLEVASPGLERSLTAKDHYQWSLGLEVAVSYRADGSITRSVGTLTKVTDEGIVVTNEGEHVITFEAITNAHTLFNFEEAMKKGAASHDELDKDTDE